MFVAVIIKVAHRHSVNSELFSTPKVHSFAFLEAKVLKYLANPCSKRSLYTN
jgi:hypothetical protein